MFPDPADGADHDADLGPELGAPSVEAVLNRLAGGDPRAPDLVRAAALAHPYRADIQAAAALVSADPQLWLDRARTFAHTRRDRQFVAIVAEHVSGGAERSRVLARQHLATFPDDVLIGWLSQRR